MPRFSSKSSLSSASSSVEGLFRPSTDCETTVLFRVDDTRRTSSAASASSYVSSSTSSDHTEYRVSLTTQFVEFSDSVIVVWRRYSQFLRLYRALQTGPRYQQLMQHCPEFPPKVTFARFNPQVVELRIKRFQALLEFVAFNRTLLESPHLLAFLADTSNDPLPRGVSTSSATSTSVGSGGTQDDSLRSFALGRHYDHLHIDEIVEPLRGRTISFLSLSSSAADTVPLLAVASQMSAAGLRVQVISLDHNKAVIEAHKLKFLSLSRADTYVSLKELGTRALSSQGAKGAPKETGLVDISPNHVSSELLTSSGPSSQLTPYPFVLCNLNEWWG